MLTSRDVDMLAHRCYDTAVAKGFWEGVLDPELPTTIPIKLMLIVSEAAEALKADRDLHVKWERQHDTLEELADVVIRTLDLAHQVSGAGGDESFGRILLDKMETNRARPPKHGKRY